MRIAIQAAAFDPGAELNRFSARARGVGAVASFTGIVRDAAGILQALEIEHYPGMTEQSVAAIADQAVLRWNLAEVLVIHRHGRLTVGDPIMMVATATAHRAEAFQAAEYLMDYLKSRAPFWKKEITATGSDWVAAKSVDEDALRRW